MKRLVPIVVLVLWVLSMAWLLRYEAFPSYFTRTLAGYSSLLSGDLLVLDAWYIVRFKGEPIGYSRTWVDVEEDAASEHYRVENLTELELNILGTRQRLSFDSEAFLDIAYQMQRFSFGTRTGRYRTRVEGRRTSGTRYEVTIDTGKSRSTTQVDIPDDTVIYSPVTDMALKRLSPGQHVTLKSFNPILGQSVPVRITAEAKESVTVDGREYDAMRLAIDMNGVKLRSWIDDEGQLLRQETPLGWTIERSTFEVATQSLRDASTAPDMLRTLAVRCLGRIPSPRETHTAEYILRGVDFVPSELSTARQSVEQISPTTFRMRVAVNPGQAAHALSDEERRLALAATPYVQVDAPEIRELAQALTADLDDELEKARAIATWVDVEVANEPRVSLPSALDVLAQREGDCNEHTYLFVALARAAGLPAKIKVGVVYHEDAFYYHAWPAVYVGRWIELDPTLKQFVADATHIALLEGELQQQMKLTKVFGRLEIEVGDTAEEEALNERP